MSTLDNGDERDTPGSGVGDSVTEQLTASDTLSGSLVPDPLDEGYSPPDYDPHIDVPTPAEEARGLSLDQLLAAEVPDVGAGDDENDELSTEPGSEVGDHRSGRLGGADIGDWDGHGDGKLWGQDVGIDGGAASAEEAAVHIMDESDQDDDTEDFDS